MEPNIAWITVDSLRYDHSSVSGYERDTTPVMGDLRSEPDTASFCQGYSNGIWTRSSTASILTGTYVSHHQTGYSHTDRLPESLPTVPELLSSSGYRTICISQNAQIHPDSGLTRGFDEFFPLYGTSALKRAPLEILRRLVLSPRKNGGGVTKDTRRHPLSSVITDVTMRKFDEFSDTPIFSYIHYNDTHLPYIPPISDIQRYLPAGVDTDDAISLALDMFESSRQHIADELPYSDEEWEVIFGLYDATIEYTMNQVGRLISFIRENHPNTILIVTSDHGEYFGESGLLAHILRTDEAVSHVPLVVAGPTGVTDHDHERVQHIDITSTILNELGIDSAHLQGVDLRTDDREVVVTQRGGPRAEKNVERIASLGGEAVVSDISKGVLSTFRSPDGRIDVQGAQEREIIHQERDCEGLEAFIEEFFSSVGRPHTDRVENNISEDAKNRLSKMGYIVD